ncbi:hypothetical protein ACJMK2_002519 [Sinanodonta woodiana]|uniref:Uncharacterized protein n=1 Tax=Sinanodonta woodiana TaxID=1069815 RepID=A0ABD3XZ01_SINWO
MASDTISGNTAAGIMSQTQQDTKDYLKEFDDEYETIITTIPRDDLANELCNSLKEVANNESKLKTLVSFVNTIFNDIRESEMCYDEHDSETEDDKVFGKDPVKKNANFVLKDYILISRTYSDILHDVDGNDENDACPENEDTLSNYFILRNDIQWLSVPFLAVERNSAKNGKTPVMACMQNKDIAVKERFTLLERLIEAAADVMTRSIHLRTPLHKFTNSFLTEMNAAKLTEWKSVIDVLLTKGIWKSLVIMDIPLCVQHWQIIGNNGYTALCMALANQNVDVVETLVKHGANVNHLTNIKMSPAHVLCCEGVWSDENDTQTILLPSLRILLNAGLNLNVKGLDDSTVLHFASATLKHTVCEFLIKSGADLQATDYLKRTPLHMAVRNRHNMVIKTLINLGADIEAKDIHSDSPLTHACFHGNTNAVQILIGIGADCKVCGDLGIQPIHIAAEDGDSLMMTILQNAGYDLSTRDASGATPLHYAASDGNPDTVKYLLNQNVSKNCKDSQGLVPLDLALLRGEYNYPQVFFPNRPLRKMHELDDYLEEITEPLKTIGEPGVGIAKAILDTPELGRLHLDEEESKQIYESIQQLCLEIVERIGELDPLFQCKTYECWQHAFVEKLENIDILEYFQIIMKDSIPLDISRFCHRSKKILIAGDVLCHFVRLTKIATYDVLKRPHQHIYSGMFLLDESAIVFGDSPIPYSKLQGLTVSWRGPTYKHIDVSIDINPVLIFLPHSKKEVMYLIPKCCNKYMFSAVVETIPFDTDLWRYSTHHVEAIMMQRLPQKERDCYMLCKAFRLEPLTCRLQKLFPLDERGYMISYEDDGSCDDYSEDDYDCNDDDGEIQAEEKRNAANDHFRTDSVSSDTVKDDEGHNPDLSEHEFGFLTLRDSTEKCTPSNHLQSIFLQEAETILSASGTFSDRHLQTIPYKVYDRLKTAVETQYLTTPFFSGQNIYRQPQDEENLPTSIKLRMCYIDTIHCLLSELGFGFEC